jgi:hypothetical protein
MLLGHAHDQHAYGCQNRLCAVARKSNGRRIEACNAAMLSRQLADYKVTPFDYYDSSTKLAGERVLALAKDLPGHIADVESDL